MVSLEEAKSHCRVTTALDDDYIRTILIPAATLEVETALRRALITQTLEMSLDRFPSNGILEIPRPPLQSVTSIQYVDTAGDLQTWDSENYRVEDAGAEPSRVSPAWGVSLPAVREVTGAVLVTFVAGYGDVKRLVPANFRRAVLVVIAEMYLSRRIESPGVPMYEGKGDASVKAVIGRHKVRRFHALGRGVSK